jgi:hypothetical protein
VAAAEAKQKSEAEPFVKESLQVALNDMGLSESAIKDMTYEFYASTTGGAYDTSIVTMDTDFGIIKAQVADYGAATEEQPADTASDAALGEENGSASDAAVGTESDSASDAATGTETDSATSDAATDTETDSATSDSATDTETDSATSESATDTETDSATSDAAADAPAEPPANTWICQMVTSESGEHIFWSYFAQGQQNATQAAVMGADGSIFMQPLYDFKTDKLVPGATTSPAVTTTEGAATASEGAAGEGDSAASEGAAAEQDNTAGTSEGAAE